MLLSNGNFGDVEIWTASKFCLFNRYPVAECSVESDDASVLLSFTMEEPHFESVKYDRLSEKQKAIYEKLPKAAKRLAFGKDFGKDFDFGLHSLDAMLYDHMEKTEALYHLDYKLHNWEDPDKQLYGCVINYKYNPGWRPKIDVLITVLHEKYLEGIITKR